MNKYRAFVIVTISALLMSLLPISMAHGDDLVPRFVDQAGALTAQQGDELTSRLDDVSERHHFDVVVAVVSALDHRSSRACAEDFFLNNGYGAGPSNSGAILFLSMQEREFSFVAFGSGVDVFTPAGQVYLNKLFVPQMKNDKFYEAFMSFADAADDFLTQAEQGKPYDEGNIPRTASELTTYRLVAALITLVVALGLAGSITGGWRRKLTSVRKEDKAQEYVREGSLVLTSSQDVFQTKSIDKQRMSSSSSSSGGARGVTSSSKTRATGNSGRF